MSLHLYSDFVTEFIQTVNSSNLTTYPFIVSFIYSF